MLGFAEMRQIWEGHKTHKLLFWQSPRVLFFPKTNSSLRSFEVGAVLALAGKSELVGNVCFRINSGLVPHKIPSGNEIFTFPEGWQLELCEFASIGCTSIARGWKGQQSCARRMRTATSTYQCFSLIGWFNNQLSTFWKATGVKLGSTLGHPGLENNQLCSGRGPSPTPCDRLEKTAWSQKAPSSNPVFSILLPTDVGGSCWSFEAISSTTKWER